MTTLKFTSKGHWLGLLLALSASLSAIAQTSTVAASAPSFPTATTATTTDNAVPPPSAGAKRSAADLEKLVAPIALYPDPLLATVLPASVYPLEIVQAARFVADTNNIAKLDAQPWDDNVKELARVPDALKKMNEDLNWTIELGEAFLAQDKDVMDAIQRMRTKAQQAGTLRTSEQQTVTVTNMVVETKVEQQTVMVTNTVVQIQPASTTTVYVPTYNPYTVYYPPPGYVYNPVAPLVTFGVGMAWGAILANNCDWYHGGCYHGDVDVDIDRNVNRERNVNRDRNTNRAQNTQRKWQPDQSRLNKSGAPSATTRDSRGWGGNSTRATQRPTSGTTGARPTSSFGGQAGASPAQRPGGQAGGARPTTTWQQPSGSRPSSGFGGSQSGARQPTAGNRASSPASRPSPSQNFSRPSSGSGSAFSGVSSGSGARSASTRGAASRGGGGGGRGGGGRR
ncbi:MAG TPA: DUF3300 domain-containing protein [Verrucomicrobiae bacterium]|nr:DUF3300 domain-containing protein [Verrucomicrobiae bacterium]